VQGPEFTKREKQKSIFTAFSVVQGFQNSALDECLGVKNVICSLVTGP
jgi:hypothetical protein